MMLLCENEKLPHAYSNDPCSMCSLKKPKRISVFINRQMDTLLKLVKTQRISCIGTFLTKYRKNLVWPNGLAHLDMFVVWWGF